MHRVILQTAALWLAATHLPAAPEREAGDASPTPRILQAVAYGSESPEAQVLSAHLVQSPPPSPVLVQIVSGGWNSSPPQRTPAAIIQPYMLPEDQGGRDGGLPSDQEMEFLRRHLILK